MKNKQELLEKWEYDLLITKDMIKTALSRNDYMAVVKFEIWEKMITEFISNLKEDKISLEELEEDLLITQDMIKGNVKCKEYKVAVWQVIRAEQLIDFIDDVKELQFESNKKEPV